jgi:hypothetical protein
MSLLDVDAHIGDDLLVELRAMANVIDVKRLNLT